MGLWSRIRGAASGISRLWAGRGGRPSHASLAAFAFVLVVWVAGVAVTTQGWRSRMPAFDLLTYIHSAYELLATGSLPEHGDNGSYGSFKPAGTAWLMLPSIALFDEPRLAEYVGTASLHLATLVGLFLLARKYFGAWCGCLAVALYGLSAIGLFLAGSLWPNGRPDFFVWMVYLASEWVDRKDPRYLAGAVAVWGVGMQVDMALSPAVFLLPALWLVYRPTLRVGPLAVAAALVLVVWTPYLRFEAPRGFGDIRSQLLFRYIVPADYRDAWCDARLVLRRVGGPPEPTEAASGDTATISADREAASTVSGGDESPRELVQGMFEDRLLSNFREATDTPGASVLLLLVVLVSLVLTAATGRPGRGRGRRYGHWGMRPAWIALAAIGIGVVAYGLGVAGEGQGALTAHRLGKLLVLGGIAFLALRWSSVAADHLLARRQVELAAKSRVEQRRVLVLGLLVPWLILVAVAEPDKPERFWWLWPLQVLFLAAFLSHFLPRLGTPPAAVAIAQAAVLVLIVGNGFLTSRLEAWKEDGWSGRDAPEVEVVDYVADRIEASGLERVSVGYQLFVYPFMAKYHVLNPEYKVGAEFDLVLRYRHAITNANTCAEGVAPQDRFRVVQTTPKPEAWAPRDYFDIPLRDGFRLVRRFGPYRVFERA